MAGAFAATPARASTFRPTRTDDPTPTACKPKRCSLRDAVLAANDHHGADVVVLESGKRYELSIAGNNEDAGATGDLDLTGKTTLKPSGKKSAKIDASSIDRVLDFLAPGTVKGLVITGGGNIDTGGFDYGAGINAASDPLHISDSVISGNGDSSAEIGGGLSMAAGGSISHATVKDNLSTGNGGGLAVTSLTGSDPVLVKDSKVSGNESTGGVGGIFAGGARLTGMKITDNSSSGCAGVLLASATLTNSYVAKNEASGEGGGVCIESGESKISDSSVVDNTAGSNGGGVRQRFGSSVIEGSTIAGNEAGGDGGGFYGYVTGSANLSRSTLSKNHADGEGGGVFAGTGSQMSVGTSTLAGNTAGSVGGGLSVSGMNGPATASHVTFNNSTVAFNAAPSAGGIAASDPAIASTKSSIFALNGAGLTPLANCSATVDSGGFNLVGVSTGCGGFDESSDQVNADAKLGKLKANGGPTKTAAPKRGSDAIDQGGNACPGKDQRGVKRPKGQACDIGSVEAR